MNRISVTMAILVGASAALVSAASVAAANKVLASEARVTMPEARATALKARPGQITDAELESERGGSGLRYSFDIKDGGKTFEVGVDAKSGRVLENKAEGPNPD